MQQRHKPNSLSLALDRLEKRRLRQIPRAGQANKILVLDRDRTALVQTLLRLYHDNPDTIIAAYHLCHEDSAPEDLHIDSLPPIPHVSLEELSGMDADAVAISMETPYAATARIADRRRDYAILEKPNCYAPYVFERIPDFLESRRESLLTVYTLLEDEYSRERYASVVKARMTGDDSWIRPSGDLYAHAPTDPIPGDIVIDGGVFRFGEDLRGFSLAVGTEGSVHAFEPEPHNFRIVLEEMKGHRPANITLHNLGLFSGKAVMRIGNEASASSLETGQRLEECRVTDLDSFVRDHNLPRVDLVKLDIEGAETEALRGMADTLRRFRPKLKISAYHTPDDMWKIPLLLHSLVPDYHFAFETPAPHLVEYILFAW